MANELARQDSEGEPQVSWLQRRSLPTKLALAFGSLLLLVVITGLVAFRGLGKVDATWQQALQVGAALAQKTEQARAELQEARRHEKEFLLRWPQTGVARALDAWVQRRDAADLGRQLPVDAHSSVAADIAAFRRTLQWISTTLQHMQAETPANSAQLGDLAAKARELDQQAQEYLNGVAHIGKLLLRRGDLVSAASAMASGDDGAQKTCHAAKLRRAHAELQLALDATPGDDAAAHDVAHLRALGHALIADQLGYLRQLDAGLPFRRQAPPQPGVDQRLAVREDEVDTCSDGATDQTEDAAADQADAATTTASAMQRAAGQASSPWHQHVHAAAGSAARQFASLREADGELRRELRTFLCRADAIEQKLDDFGELGPKAVANLSERARDQAAAASFWVYLISFACVILGAALAAWLARDIREPLRDLADTARQVAGGDLDAKAWVYSHDELGEFAATFNDMTARLKAQNAKIAAQLAEIAAEHDRSERLLLNVLPLPIAERLKSKEHPIADAFDEASVLFADVVGYTALSARLPPTEVVESLSRVFTAFDAIAARLGIEKIKTIGDCYMAACGLPRHVPDHASRMADMALEMLQALQAVNKTLPAPLQLRIGLNCGPVVAGVIGERKFIYDLWGDTVNVASRMESHGLPGEAQMPAHMFERISHTHAAERRGTIEVKGKGPMETWLLRGRLAGWSGQSMNEDD